MHQLTVIIQFAVEKLLRKSSIQVNVVTGHLDLTAATPGTVNWVDELSWTGKRVGTTRHIIVNKKIQGYYKTQDQLTMYSVWRSGRAVPLQNPATMEWILQRIIITNKRTQFFIPFVLYGCHPFLLSFINKIASIDAMKADFCYSIFVVSLSQSAINRAIPVTLISISVHLH